MKNLDKSIQDTWKILGDLVEDIEYKYGYKLWKRYKSNVVVTSKTNNEEILVIFWTESNVTIESTTSDLILDIGEVINFIGKYKELLIASDILEEYQDVD